LASRNPPGRQLRLRQGILYGFSVSQMEDQRPESDGKPDFRRHLRFPGFRVSPGRIAGARLSRIHEMHQEGSGYGEASDPTSGHSPLRLWKLSREDSEPGPGVGCLSAVLVIGLCIMVPDALGALGARCVLAIVWGPMLGVFVIGVLVVRAWKRRAGLPPPSSP
jgi:hypothetical protein